MIKIQKGDGLILQSGSRMIAEGRLWNRGNVLFDDWRVVAWCEDRSYRFAIQLIAITEVWRGEKCIYDVEVDIV